jgi:hypothetical protein
MRSTQERAHQLYEVGRLAFLDALEIVQLIELMEVQNRGRVVSRLSDAGAGRAGIVVRNSLTARITLLVAGSYAPARPDDFHLRQAFKLLEDTAVRCIAESHGDAKQIAAVEVLWQALCADPRQAVVKHFRDKFTAHKAVANPAIPLPKYSEFFAFAHETASIMEGLAHALGGTKETIDEHRDAIAGSAFSFWRPWD